MVVAISSAWGSQSPWPMYGADRFHTFSTWAVGPSHPAFKWKVAMSATGQPSIGPDGTIYFNSVLASTASMLTAVSPNGVVRWSQPAYSGAAISDDGCLYVAYDQWSSRCYRPDGSVAWDHPGVYIQRAPVLASDGNIWVTGAKLTPGGALVPPALGYADWPVCESRGIVGPQDAGPDVYVVRVYGDIPYLGAKYLAQNAQGNWVWNARWSRAIDRCVAVAVAPDGRVIVTGGTSVMALTPQGTEVWSVDAGGSAKWFAVGAGGVVYTSAYDSSYNCRTIAIGPDGSVLWTNAVVYNNLSYLIIDGGGTLYVRTPTGVTALDSTNGTTKWQITFGAAPGGNPMVLGADGTMYVGSVDGYLYAFWDAAQRIGLAKTVPNGAAVAPADVVVTAVFGNYFYVESLDRSSGILAYKPGHGQGQGAKISISGSIQTDDNGERYVDVEAIVPRGGDSVRPLGMVNRAVGGGDFSYDAASKAGQKGVKDGFGLNNIGLLVRTWGKFTKTGDTTFTIDDGSGLNVKCLVPTGVTIDPNWQFVGVTGISSCEKVGEELHRLLRVREQSDITP